MVQRRVNRASEDAEELTHVSLQAILLADSFATKFRPITLERPKVSSFHFNFHFYVFGLLYLMINWTNLLYFMQIFFILIVCLLCSIDWLEETPEKNYIDKNYWCLWVYKIIHFLLMLFIWLFFPFMIDCLIGVNLSTYCWELKLNIW